MQEIAGLTESYLQHFRAIEASAPEDERAIARSMVVHESALHRFAERELAGDTENSLADISAELHWPLAEAISFTNGTTSPRRSEPPTAFAPR